jgi:hypothetical protein
MAIATAGCNAARRRGSGDKTNQRDKGAQQGDDGHDNFEIDAHRKPPFDMR